MALYQVRISYDGTDFFGFQRQLNCRMVQGEIETAIRKIGWEEISIKGAGRTDTGVHANGQVISFSLQWNHSTSELLRAMNKHLPNDISANSAVKPDVGFHPRYHVTAKTYRYQIYFSPYPEALLERYGWRIWPWINLENLQSISELFVGKHEFQLFGKPPSKQGATVRTIQSVDWNHARDDRVNFRIVGKSFLYHMVRRIMFIVIRAGQGRVTPDAILNSLEGKGSLPTGIAPAKGLFLEKVEY